jgi:soluble lytic murein transglycosylase-like protein
MMRRLTDILTVLFVTVVVAIVVFTYGTLVYGETQDIKTIITHAANQNNINPKLLYAVCQLESGLNAVAVNQDDGGSPSYGLCQIKLETARIYNSKLTIRKLFDPEINANYAAKHLQTLLKRYHNEEYAVCSYNLGYLKLNYEGKPWNRGYYKKVSILMKQMARDY